MLSQQWFGEAPPYHFIAIISAKSDYKANSTSCNTVGDFAGRVTRHLYVMKQIVNTLNNQQCRQNSDDVIRRCNMPSCVSIVFLLEKVNVALNQEKTQ